MSEANKGISCGACSDAKVPAEQCNHVRVGKTKKDKESGSWSNRFANRVLRVQWLAEGKGNNVFPRGSCNGQKNRFVTT